MGRYAILLVDTVAEQQVSYILSFFGSNSIKLDKGELLIAVSEELAPADNGCTMLYNFHLASDKNTTLHLDIDGSSAVLTDPEFMLLQAVTTPLDRFKAYKSGKCTWGLSLKVGDPVDVDDSWVDAPVAAIVRYIGEISDHCGTMFGVEIVVRKSCLICPYQSLVLRPSPSYCLFRGEPGNEATISVDEEFSAWGDSDGTWKGVRYFKCKANGGSFVPLDKISRALHVATEDSAKTEVPRAPQDSEEVKTTAAITSSGHCDENEATTNPGFEIGSLVQVIDPPLYGVIRVIEKLPGMQEMAAGIELEEYGKKCTDGTWQGKRYFTCPPGRGFFCPLSKLKADQRFADFAAKFDSLLKNPLERCPLEEQEHQSVFRDQLAKYLGKERGIQGHYNSCYLDATVFGLFALSDVFDPMLQTKARDPAGEEIRGMLWKGIVNPLRKNGVVRYESVMSLRNKLEDLGKIKGINQDEKDPEEFLNMLFKHSLRVDSFISIRRPYGIEKEFFVQLFLEPDESLKLPPTVGQLLNKMFKEQNISFSEAPKKLLIQIPRYGKQFKTYEKVVAGLQLDVTDLIDPPDLDTSQSNEECTDARSSLRLLSVICIKTSHYVCFARAISQNRWIFFDSMADRLYDKFNIPEGVDCTEELNEWVYSGSERLQSTPYRELPELVQRFTHDVYLCVYIS